MRCRARTGRRRIQAAHRVTHSHLTRCHAHLSVRSTQHHHGARHCTHVTHRTTRTTHGTGHLAQDQARVRQVVKALRSQHTTQRGHSTTRSRWSKEILIGHTRHGRATRMRTRTGNHKHFAAGAIKRQTQGQTRGNVRSQRHRGRRTKSVKTGTINVLGMRQRRGLKNASARRRSGRTNRIGHRDQTHGTTAHHLYRQRETFTNLQLSVQRHMRSRSGQSSTGKGISRRSTLPKGTHRRRTTRRKTTRRTGDRGNHRGTRNAATLAHQGQLNSSTRVINRHNNATGTLRRAHRSGRLRQDQGPTGRQTAHGSSRAGLRRVRLTTRVTRTAGQRRNSAHHRRVHQTRRLGTIRARPRLLLRR